MSIIDRLGRNLQFSAYSRAVVILSSLFLTPFILKRVDLELYGLNVLIISIVGYFNILNLGLTSGVSRFTAAFFGEGKLEKISEILHFGIKFFVGIGIIVSFSLFGLSFFYEKLFHVQAAIAAKGRVLLFIYAVSSFFVWVNIPFQGILKGLQRIDIVSKVTLAVSMLNVPLALIILTYTKSYLLYIGLLQFITVLVSCVNIICAIRLIPDFKFKRSTISKPLRKQLVNFSGWYFVASIFSLVIFQIDNLVISVFIGVSAVAIYSIAFVIHNLIRGLTGLLASPFYYTITAEFATRDKDSRNALITKVGRIQAAILVPIVIIIIVSADSFILAWVGPRFTGAILPCKILLSYWLFNITRDVLSHGVVGGKGKIIESVRLYGFVAVANLILSLILVKFIGITGVALGTAIPWIIASFFYIHRFCKILSLPVSDFIRGAVMPNLPHYSLALALSILAQRFMQGEGIIFVAAIMGIVYGVSLCLGYALLSADNKRVVRKLMVLRA